MQASYSIPTEELHKLSPDSQKAILRFLSHKPEPSDLTSFPLKRLGAVLALLFEKNEHIYVLLTTRSKHLRSHPGQTALPGGKCEESDSGLLETALREAHEEVGLPRNSPSIYPLCMLQPFVSLHSITVTPVVAWLTDLSILDGLSKCDDEVDAIFEHPLEAILDPSLAMPLVEKGSMDWPYETRLYSTSDQRRQGIQYRMHRFQSVASPITGLTADIVIMTAEIAYNRMPSYNRWAPGQARTFAEMRSLLDDHDVHVRETSGTVR